MNNERATLTVIEAGKILGISKSHAYDLVNGGEIPSIRLGRRIVVPRRALERFLESSIEQIEQKAS